MYIGGGVAGPGPGKWGIGMGGGVGGPACGVDRCWIGMGGGVSGGGLNTGGLSGGGVSGGGVSGGGVSGGGVSGGGDTGRCCHAGVTDGGGAISAAIRVPSPSSLAESEAWLAGATP